MASGPVTSWQIDGENVKTVSDFIFLDSKITGDFVCKVMSLLFNTLSRFVTDFLLRSKHLLISWLQSPSAVILQPKKIKMFPLVPDLFAMK